MPNETFIVNYPLTDPWHIDGHSENVVFGIRYGRWCGKVLADGEQERPYCEGKHLDHVQKPHSDEFWCLRYCKECAKLPADENKPRR